MLHIILGKMKKNNESCQIRQTVACGGDLQDLIEFFDFFLGSVFIHVNPV